MNLSSSYPFAPVTFVAPNHHNPLPSYGTYVAPTFMLLNVHGGEMAY